MNEERTICSCCGKVCDGVANIHVAMFDNDQENRLLNMKSYHFKCFREEAGKEYIFYDQLSERDGRIGDTCGKCDKAKSQTGVVILETNSEGNQMWIQYFHTECFLENAGEDFFG